MRVLREVSIFSDGSMPGPQSMQSLMRIDGWNQETQRDPGGNLRNRAGELRAQPSLQTNTSL